jgi:hypothetical protein
MLFLLVSIQPISVGFAFPAPPTPPASKGVDPKDALTVIGAGGNSSDALAGNLRGFLVRSLPNPLFEDHKHWDLRKQGPLGNWQKDGQWYRVRVQVVNPADSLVLDLRDVQTPEPGRKTFTLFLCFDATVEVERQHWAMGLRLYSGSTRARMRMKATLNCEAISRTESKGKVLPDLVLRLRVVRSDLRYDNLVVEHTAGVGGEAAKLLGDLVVRGVRELKPSLERELLRKANAAVVKAGDTKEVRISVLKFLGGQGEKAKPENQVKPPR